jgi:hypothetical protein
MVNEFAGRNFPCGSFIPAGPAYTNVSAANKICSTPGAKAGLDFVLGSDYVETSFSYVHSHLWRNFGILLAYIVGVLYPAYVPQTVIEHALPGRLLCHAFDLHRIHLCGQVKGRGSRLHARAYSSRAACA